MSNSITEEELNNINNLKQKVVLATANAETAVLLKKNAELEVNNYILNIYNKYDIKVKTDVISTSGEIIKGKVEDTEKKENNNE